MRPGGVDSARPQFGDRRRDDLDLLGAESAVFAGMRIESRKGEAGICNAKALLKVTRDNFARRDDQFARQAFGRVTERDMNCYRNDCEFLRPQHHHRAIVAAIMAMREFGQKFRVPGMFEAGFIENRFRDRIGDDGARFAPGDACHRPLDGIQR